MIRVHNLETEEIIDRDLTLEEIAQNNARDLLLEAQIETAAEASAAKAALLERLGITEEEAKLLLS